ncbi:hypothetical protein PGTUg99_025940 [Puccinia graminis f. sp. tritici]|uniref:Uncharacterized protein n=1 Tax=Puccinia graminis f. sp. tritici TaxID=56615 RepID=A0A5B0PN65_PUCGR|nr:hypothetical protein PGTUg99_025940 [Puccinia graminis f. sp. tritici]
MGAENEQPEIPKRAALSRSAQQCVTVGLAPVDVERFNFAQEAVGKSTRSTPVKTAVLTKSRQRISISETCCPLAIYRKHIHIVESWDSLETKRSSASVFPPPMTWLPLIYELLKLLAFILHCTCRQSQPTASEQGLKVYPNSDKNPRTLWRFS